MKLLLPQFRTPWLQEALGPHIKNFKSTRDLMMLMQMALFDEILAELKEAK